MYKLIIFDADGTLTPQRDGSCGPFERRLLPGVAEKCAELRATYAALAIASNQSPNRRENDIFNQLQWTADELGIIDDLVWYATHPEGQKPAPDMLLAIMYRAGATPEQTLFVGDRDTDRQAADNAGCDFAWAADFFGWPPGQ